MAESVLIGKPVHTLDQEESRKSERINHILSNLLELAAGKFNISELAEIQNDSLDAIDRGLVMLGEQLESNKKQQEQFIIEKENMMREIHHRVKNNMQIISSLLNLQMADFTDEITRNAFRQSQLRIKSMALIHEMLYKSDDFSKVNLQEYLQKMVSLLIHSITGPNENIRLSLKVEQVKINIDSAVSIGLLVNEAVTNSLIHGLEREGEIYIHFFTGEEGECFLEIGDNGKGFNETETKQGLGLRLISILNDQLNGALSRKLEKGTHYSIRFNQNK